MSECKKPNGVELSFTAEEYAEDLKLSRFAAENSNKFVAILGGGDISVNSEYYKNAFALSKFLASNGVSIITGGGRGIMEAGNKGAKLSGAKVCSCGLNVKSIRELRDFDKSYVEPQYDLYFNTVSIRLLTLIGSGDAIVFFPGGFGTLEEFFTLLVRMKVAMMQRVPVFLFDSTFWGGLKSWLESVNNMEHMIKCVDMEIFCIEDDISELGQKIVSYLNGGN